jgi:nitric oxide reductase NorD protein
MAEAEDVIVDAAKHVTGFLQAQWRRKSPQRLQPAALADHIQRLELLVAAAFGRALKIRPAQPPAPRTLLRRLFDRNPSPGKAIPATDGHSIWLPETLATTDPEEALARYRLMALRQGMRAVRGSADLPIAQEPPPVQDLYLLLEAASADAALARLFPGTRAKLDSRHHEVTASPAASLARARELAPRTRMPRDEWTGELREAPLAFEKDIAPGEEEFDATPARSAKLKRTPKVREPAAGEDEHKPGAFMVQTAQPNESAEDPMGMQRPTDRDEATAAEDLAESVADLPEARLVTRPGSPKEVLLSSEVPRSRAKTKATPLPCGIAYPEWDYRIGGYRTPGAIVRTPEALLGDPAWAAATLERHAALLGTIRRRFEMLRARRVRLRRQVDGEEIDLEACVESAVDFRAGLPRSERLYQTLRPARREMALALLIDVSGSTDSWVSGNRRIIDVEREALLLVCIALETMRERYTVQAFSGEGPGAVTVRSVKSFDEHHGSEVSRRIAALEPERYTRVGAALRHVTAMLMREPVRHRLLLLLSDGKPNDVDHYEGRYGVQDMRQAVLEAKLQGIAPFCLTVDRAAASYLTGVFGAAQYALLPRPELLPTALLDWIRRIASI